MTDQDLKALAKYIVEHLVNKQIGNKGGYNVAFLTEEQMFEYQCLLLNDNITKLQIGIDSAVESENYELASKLKEELQIAKEILEEIKSDYENNK